MTILEGPNEIPFVFLEAKQEAIKVIMSNLEINHSNL